MNGAKYEVTRLSRYRCAILLMTFVAYVCYHMSRKPISVVKTRLLNCTGDEGSDYANAGHGNIVIPGSQDNDSVCSSFICKCGLAKITILVGYFFFPERCILRYIVLISFLFFFF